MLKDTHQNLYFTFNDANDSAENHLARKVGKDLAASIYPLILEFFFCC